MKANAVIFVDIDGVLVTHRSHFSNPNRTSVMRTIDPVGVGLLNSVKAATGCELVICSRWLRTAHPESVVARLREEGLDLRELSDDGSPVPHVWHRPDEPKNTSIQTAMIQWLEDFAEPDAKSVVLNDEDVLEQGQETDTDMFLVMVDPADGIGFSDAVNTVELLGGSQAVDKFLTVIPEIERRR